MRVLASAANSSVMQTRFLFQKYATSKPVAASYPPHVDRRLRPLHIMLRSSVHSGRRHVAGPQYSSCSTSTKLDTGANSSSARCEKSDAGRDENGTRLPDAPPRPGIRRAPGSVLAPRPGTRARAAPRDPCSRRAPKPVLAPRPGTRARGAPMVPPQGPAAAARTRSTGAEERAHRAPQIREIDARPEHAQDHPTRCGTRGTPVRGPGRENTAGDRHAPPSRASWERVHASPWGEPGTQDHEQGGRVSAPLRATRNRTGSQRRPQRQKRSTTNARWEMLLPSVRPLEFTESGPSLCSSRKPTRARVVRSAESNNHVPAGPAEPVEPCQSSAKRHQAQLTDVFARKHHKARPARTGT
jgi:hypothetical protein